jgi:predicted anti-sigma-YlaC factor YlaD
LKTDLQEREAEHQSRAAEARKMKAKVEESKKTTVEDLTRGIVNYKYLGLDFEKAEGNRLRYVSMVPVSVI